MHDIADLESRGLPGMFLASTEFRDAAAAQARSLGFDPAAVFIPHPIQDRTDDEMRDLADAALEDILAALVVPPELGQAQRSGTLNRPV